MDEKTQTLTTEPQTQTSPPAEAPEAPPSEAPPAEAPERSPVSGTRDLEARLAATLDANSRLARGRDTEKEQKLVARAELREAKKTHTAQLHDAQARLELALAGVHDPSLLSAFSLSLVAGGDPTKFKAEAARLAAAAKVGRVPTGPPPPTVNTTTSPTATKTDLYSRQLRTLDKYFP